MKKTFAITALLVSSFVNAAGYDTDKHWQQQADISAAKRDYQKTIASVKNAQKELPDVPAEYWQNEEAKKVLVLYAGLKKAMAERTVGELIKKGKEIEKSSTQVAGLYSRFDKEYGSCKAYQALTKAGWVSSIASFSSGVMGVYPRGTTEDHAFLTLACKYSKSFSLKELKGEGRWKMSLMQVENEAMKARFLTYVFQPDTTVQGLWHIASGDLKNNGGVTKLDQSAAGWVYTRTALLMMGMPQKFVTWSELKDVPTMALETNRTAIYSEIMNNWGDYVYLEKIQEIVLDAWVNTDVKLRTDLTMFLTNPADLPLPSTVEMAAIVEAMEDEAEAEGEDTL